MPCSVGGGRPLSDHTHHHRHTGVLDLSWQRFGEVWRGLVEKVTRDFQPEAVVGIAKGGVLPGACIASALSVDFYPIKLSTRRNEQTVLDRPRVVTPPPAEVNGRRLLLVDDITITFKTLELAQQLLADAGATEIRCASLCVHPHSQKPEWYGISSDAVILLPWDRDVYQGGEWLLNPEYAAEIAETEERG